MQHPAPARPAATLMLVRDTPRFQVLMATRHAAARFGAGALVFPGGVVEPGDEDRAWAGVARGYADIPAGERALRIAAVREAFEETGVLTAHPGKQETFRVEETGERDGASFLDLLRQRGLELDLAAMALFARWITPEHMPKRFDTWFYLALAPAGQSAVSDGIETVDAEWIAPAEALRLGEAGRRKLMFPTRLNLELLARSSTVDEALAAARTRSVVPVLPRLERRIGGDVVLIPEAAGYGFGEAPASVLA